MKYLYKFTTKTGPTGLYQVDLKHPILPLDKAKAKVERVIKDVYRLTQSGRWDQVESGIPGIPGWRIKAGDNSLCLDPVAEGVVQLGLAALPIPLGKTGRDIEQLLTAEVTDAGRAIAKAVEDEQASGAGIKRIEIERLDDYEAGQWSMVLIVAYVKASPGEGDALWDRMLSRAEQYAQMSGEAAQRALGERVGLIVRWRGV